MPRSTFLAACRARASATLAAACVGAVVSGFYAVADWPNGNPVATMTIGAIIGVFIYAFIYVLEKLAGQTIDRFGGTTRAVGHALLFVAGGTVGGVLGLIAGVRLYGHSLTIADLFGGSGRGRLFVVMAGATALVAASGFRAYDLLRDRLARTVIQLKEREWAEKEIELARSIQTRLLPPSLIEADGYIVAARNLPARFVAGDFYDVVRLDDGSLVIVVADVAGKGLGASLIMASVKAVLPFVARESAQQAMSMLNAKLRQELGRREFVALAYARLRPGDGSVEILNAGFPEPYLVARGSVRALTTKGERLPLGLRNDVAYEPLVTTLGDGERLVFLSDGIPEAPVHGEPLGYDRVASILGSMNGDAHGEQWLDRFLDVVRATVDETLADDWTAVVVERSESR